MSKQIKSALVSTVLMAVLAMAMYVISVGNIIHINAQALLNVGVMSLMTGIVSMIKSLATTTNGKFAGVKIK